MTKKEISEIFSLWSLNWPSAEMFQGGADLLNARITLYANRLKDVNYWYGRRGAMVSIDKRKFPPSIAEYKEDIASVMKETKDQVDFLYNQITCDIYFSKQEGKSIDAILRDMLPAGRAVIEKMGGWKAFAPDDQPFYNRDGFLEAYLKLQAEREGLPADSNKRLPPQK